MQVQKNFRAAENNKNKVARSNVGTGRIKRENLKGHPPTAIWLSRKYRRLNDNFSALEVDNFMRYINLLTYLLLLRYA